MFGVVGSLFMIFAGLLGARKKVPVWRLGRAQDWMRGHLWLGLLSLPVIFFHAGFRFGGLLTTVLMVLLILVVASGIFGAVLQHYMPPVMTVRIPMETIFEQIDRVRAQLVAEADAMVEEVCGPRIAPPVAPAAKSGRVATMTTVASMTIPSRDLITARCARFCETKKIRIQFCHPRESSWSLRGLCTLLPGDLHTIVQVPGRVMRRGADNSGGRSSTTTGCTDG